MIIETARLTLRRAEPRDAQALHAIYGDPEVMRYWSTGPDTALSQTMRRVERQLDQDPVEYFTWEMAGTAIGQGGHFESGEIGYILRRDHWGKGIATEALRAIIPHIWSVTGFAALRAEVDPRNLGSVAVLTRLGFTVAGFAQKNYPLLGEFLDTAYFRLPRPEE